jgi:hypothetical protein
MTRWLKLAAVSLVVLVVGCAALVGPDRYSDDPAAARIQGLTDFCIGYGALRDAATNFLIVDAARANPVLSVSAVEGYASARAFIKPFCAQTFDPLSADFDLKTLEKELLKIRLILLAKEEA